VWGVGRRGQFFALCGDRGTALSEQEGQDFRNGRGKRSVSVSALSFDSMAEAYRKGGFDDTGAGLLGGATIYSLANWSLSKVGYVELRGGHYIYCASRLFVD
jgi:hypothetical protein